MPDNQHIEQCMTGHPIRTCIMTCLAIVPGLLLPSVCVTIQSGGPRFEVVLQDHETGKDLGECLMVRSVEAGQWHEWAWYWLYVDTYADKFHTVSADIERVTSGDTLSTPALFGVCYPNGLFTYKKRKKRYMWVFFREGYAPEWRGEHSIRLMCRENQGRLIVDMLPESDEVGQSLLYRRAVEAVNDTLPIMAKSNPLRRELLLLLTNQLKLLFGEELNDCPLRPKIQKLLAEQPENED